MAIAKRPTPKKVNASANVDSFISSAPDAKKGFLRGSRSQISHTLPPEMVAKVDAFAKVKGMTGAGFINYAVSELIERQPIQ